MSGVRAGLVLELLRDAGEDGASAASIASACGARWWRRLIGELRGEGFEIFEDASERFWLLSEPDVEKVIVSRPSGIASRDDGLLSAGGSVERTVGFSPTIRVDGSLSASDTGTLFELPVVPVVYREEAA